MKSVTDQMLKSTCPQKSQKRLTLGLLNPEPLGLNPILLWKGVAQAVQNRDANLICFAGRILESPYGFDAQGNILYDWITPENIDGLVIWSSFLGLATQAEKLKHFCERYRPLPVICVGEKVEGFPAVLLDNYGSMRQILVHLVEDHGYRRLAFIRGPEGHLEAEERYRAYREVLADYNLPFDPHLIAPGEFVWPLDLTAGRAAIDLLLDQRQTNFEAIIAANDNMALSAMEALRERGISVPDDIAVAGFDDIPAGRCTFPALTTSSLRLFEQGYQAAEILLDQLAGRSIPDRVVVPPRMVTRQSCGCSTIKRPVEAGPSLVQIKGDGPPVWLDPDLTGPGRHLLTLMERALQPEPDNFAGLIDPALVKPVLQAFLAELSKPGSSRLIIALEQALRQTVLSGADLTLWHQAFSVLHDQFQNLRVEYPETRFRIEGLCREAHLLISQSAGAAQMSRQMATEQKMQILHEFGQRLVTTFDLSKLMDQLAHNLPRLGIKRCYLSLYEQPDPQLAPSAPDSHPFAWSRLMLGYDETTRLQIKVESHRFPSQCLLPGGLAHSSDRIDFLVEPLYFQQDQLGFIIFATNETESTICETLRGQISSALKGALLFESRRQTEIMLARRATQLKLLSSISGQIAGVLDLNQLLNRTTDLVNRSFGYHHVAIFLLEQRSNQLLMRAKAGAFAHFFPPNHRFEIGRGMVGWVAQHRQRLLANDVQSNSYYVNFFPGEISTRSELSVPIRMGREIFGVFDVQSPQLNAFDENDILVLETLADQVAVAIDNARLYAQAQQDLAERIQAEETLQLYTQKLEHSNRELQEFAYVASHDLQEPLRKVQAFGERLRTKYSAVLDERGQDYLIRMTNATSRMQALIQALLSYSRVTTQAQPFAAIALEEVARQVVSDLEVQLEQMAGRVEIGPLPTIEADPTQMRQLLQNLISNGLKFHRPDQPPLVTVRAQPAPDPRPSAAPASATEWCHLIISDNGIGFDPKYADRIFQVFQRLHNYTEYEGTGIGLATCRKIVERHNGRITVESVPNQGTTFIICLPVRQSRREAGLP